AWRDPARGGARDARDGAAAPSAYRRQLALREAHAAGGAPVPARAPPARGRAGRPSHLAGAAARAQAPSRAEAPSPPPSHDPAPCFGGAAPGGAWSDGRTPAEPPGHP